VPTVVDGLAALGPLTPSTTPKLLWLNSPGNPTGKVLGVEHLAKVVAWARRHGVVVASDECYAELDWRERDPSSEEPPTTPSILDPRVTDGSHEGLLAVYSLSKQSNLAGYRAAFVAGDPSLVGRLLEVRKHAGMIMPAPVQSAMAAALDDDTHVAEQKARYAARRARLKPAVEGAGLRVDDSEAGLYLWCTRGEDAWATVGWLADRGILVAPGTFYGAAGGQHVRIALTASDERIEAAAERLA
jgi:succinyldiaminopimelate transaminase